MVTKIFLPRNIHYLKGYRALMKLECWLAVLLFLMVSPASAEVSAEQSLDWDCWIQEENSNPVSISCIRDRGDLAHTHENVEDDLEDLLLDHIHHQIHNGDTGELGNLISKNIKVFRNGAIWSIDIHLAPFASSWEEGRPQMLVRTLLCPGHLPCKVNIKQPAEPPPDPVPQKKKKKSRAS
jgi:hypothetical protein